MNNLISVIMPVFNAGKYLNESVGSVLNQTYRNFEFLIFNDGSSDNSLSILEKFSSIDDRIQIFHSPVNKGYLVHLNEGLKIAKGQYIARMDSDDICFPNRFKKQVDYLMERNVDLVGSNVIFFSEKRSIFNRKSNQALSHEELKAQMLFSSPVFHPTVMFKRRMVDTGDYYYDEKYYPAEDYELWSRLLLKYTFENIRYPLLYYRQSAGQISKLKNTTQRDYAFDARCRYLENLCNFVPTMWEKSILKEFFYNSYRKFSAAENQSLFELFRKMGDSISDIKVRKFYYKHLLNNISYLSSKKNKFYSYYLKELGDYYKGNFTNKFNGLIRQALK